MVCTRAARRAGFTRGELVMSVLVIAVMAAIVIPQFTAGQRDARRSNLRGQLITLRRQIDLFRRQHGGALPDLVGRQWEPLLGRTDSAGAADPMGGQFGPYLEKMPTNPLNGNSVVAGKPGVDVGWVYDGATGKLRATNRTATRMFDEVSGLVE
jgi:general secretion pathway protein G